MTEEGFKTNRALVITLIPLFNYAPKLPKADASLHNKS